MSTAPENEFDLEKLFLPAWAQEPSSAKQYAQYEGREVEFPDRRSERRGGRPPGRKGPPGGRRAPGAAEGRRDDSRPREDRGRAPQGKGGSERGLGPDRRGGPRGDRQDRPERREHREPPQPLPEINLSFVPDEKGVESLARQIKMTGRAYPLFDIAQMILQKPERHSVGFSVVKNAEGKPVQPLFVCALDDTLWLSEDEAIAHVLKKHFNTFYQEERTPTEPPKGKYTFVAQCGMSGVVLGPPNYHDYQNQLRKLHAEHFSRMPFEAFKARVKIVRDEEVVKRWIDEQSFKTEYICLNMPEPLRLNSMEALEKHFREQHKENIIKPVESHTLAGTAARSLRSPQLTRLVRQVWEDQRRFPLQIATVLSQQFAGHGLQFFKVNKTITHVSVARPHYLDMEATPVSEGVKRLVDYINANPKSTRRRLLDALAPAPAPASEAPGVPPAEAAQATPEQTAMVSDLHWLIHQGHVIEFANGTLETAKKPTPKPPRPEAKPSPAAATPAPAEPAAHPPGSEISPTEPAPADSVASAEPAPMPPPAGTPPEEERPDFQRPADPPAVSRLPPSSPNSTEAANFPAEASVVQPE